jgi:hypothetical protein
MCQLVKKLKKLEIDEAYKVFDEEKKNLDEQDKKEISQELAARYHEEVISYRACTD